MTSMSPLVATTRPVKFNLLSSHISHAISPIIYTFPLRHTIRFDHLIFVNTLTSAVACKELGPLTESNLYSGCVTASDTTYTSQEALNYDMTGANFSVNNCLFANCSGVPYLFEMSNSLLDFQNSTVQDCALSLIKIETAVTTSKIYNTTFRRVSGVIDVDEGEMKFDSCNFEDIKSSSTPAFNFNSCSKIVFQNCFFNYNFNGGFIVEDTTDFRFDRVNYNCTQEIKLGDKSYAMVVNSCFNGSSIPFSGGNIIDENNDKHVHCPHQIPSQSLTSEKKAYAITTVVVFSVGFAALFITLIILVTCKVKEEKVQYGKLHADELPDDSRDPREISD
ncbi:hypothetical protein M9Y10_009982 [Tritrichomonas musculus]|uniref:Uncharacterized protein n=1 Tax=Tritrichomonas musculus TaxID=1915356 RepID=A0ABR2IPY6_9EUKA